MSKQIRVDYSNILSFVDEKAVLSLEKDIQKAHQNINNKTGKGNDYLGGVN